MQCKRACPLYPRKRTYRPYRGLATAASRRHGVGVIPANASRQLFQKTLPQTNNPRTVRKTCRVLAALDLAVAALRNLKFHFAFRLAAGLGRACILQRAVHLPCLDPLPALCVFHVRWWFRVI